MELYNLQGLKDMSGGDMEFVQQVLQMTLEDLPTVVNRLESALANENWAEIFQVAHKIKPTMQTIGINDQIWENILLINDYTKNLKNLNEIPNLVQNLCQNFKQLQIQLSKELINS